jgi:PhnB protein
LLDEKRKIFSASMSGTSSFARGRDEPKQKRGQTANEKTMTTTKSNPNKVVQPYLFFEGRCEEAIEFYRNALGAEVEMLMRFKDNPDAQGPDMCAPGAEDKVLHVSFRVGDSTVMASDGRCQGNPSFQGFSLSLTVPDEAEADRLFAALADGGQEQVPLTKTFFSPRFGMVADRFGVSWMIYVAA